MDVTYFPKEEEKTGFIERALQRLRGVAPQRPEALRLPHISGFLGRGSCRGGSVDMSRAQEFIALTVIFKAFSMCLFPVCRQ